MQATWRTYYETRHEGLGTTYERFVLHDHFRRIADQYNVKNVLEAPVFGMTGVSGINSVWWARQGAQVTLVDDDSERLTRIEEVWRELSLEANLVYLSKPYASLPFEDGMFDMSWNFAALPLLADSKSLLLELARVTRKAIFICVPNEGNLLRPLIRILHRRKSNYESGIESLRLVEKILKGTNWMAVETGYLDVPPWPDIATTKERLFRKMRLRRLAGRLERKLATSDRLCILDYYMGGNEAMEGRMRRYAVLENGPNWLKRIWAHHTYQIFTPLNPVR